MPALSTCCHLSSCPGLPPLILEHVYSFAESWCFARQAEFGTGSPIQELVSTGGLGTQRCDRAIEVNQIT